MRICFVVLSLWLSLGSAHADTYELFTCFDSEEPVKHEINLTAGSLQSFSLGEAEDWKPKPEGRHRIVVHHAIHNPNLDTPTLQYKLTFSNKSIVYINHARNAPEAEGHIVKNTDLEKLVPFKNCAYEQIQEKEDAEFLLRLLGF